MLADLGLYGSFMHFESERVYSLVLLGVAIDS